MGVALAATPGSARCCPGQVTVVSQHKKPTARFHAALPLAASTARVFSRRRQHAVQPRLLACRPIVASVSIAGGEEGSTRKGSIEVGGDVGSTWPDGTFKGDWETWECPPKERYLVTHRPWRVRVTGVDPLYLPYLETLV